MNFGGVVQSVSTTRRRKVIGTAFCSRKQLSRKWVIYIFQGGLLKLLSRQEVLRCTARRVGAVQLVQCLRFRQDRFLIITELIRISRVVIEQKCIVPIFEEYDCVWCQHSSRR